MSIQIYDYFINEFSLDEMEFGFFEDDIKKAISRIEEIKKLKVLKNDINITDEEFIKMVLSYGSIRFQKYLPGLVETIIGNDYKLSIIKTTIPDAKAIMDVDNEYILKNQKYGLLAFSIFQSMDVNIGKFRVYSFDNIKEMVAQRQIVLYREEKTYKNVSYKKMKRYYDDYEKDLLCSVEPLERGNNILNILKYYKLLGYVRSKITDDMLDAELLRIEEDLNQRLIMISQDKDVGNEYIKK